MVVHSLPRLQCKSKIMQLRGKTTELIKDILHSQGFWNGRYQCSVCDKRPHRFERIPDSYIQQLDSNDFIHSIFATETLNILNYSCINCSATDRDRLYALYFRDALLQIDQTDKLKLIEFAPSQLQFFLKSYDFIDYRSADINGTADDTVDIMDLNIYQTNSVDVFVCSHVLEHVENDQQAMRELYRILKPGGWGICMVPILLSITDVIEIPTVSSDKERWKYYGQDDHVRMYSKQGFVHRLTEAGFTVSQLGIKHFGVEKFEKYGIHPRSVLYVVHKKQKA